MENKKRRTADAFGDRGFISFLQSAQRPSGNVDPEFIQKMIPGVDPEQLGERVGADADGLFRLAAVVWDTDERLALAMFREAADAGSLEALAALAEGENWIGDHEQAVADLRAALELEAGNRARLQGLLGESLALSRGPSDSREIEGLLRAGLEDSAEFALPLIQLLLSEERVAEGRRMAEWAVEAEVYGAALVLGNILSDAPETADAAEAAYWRGIATGDAHSAHNLAVLMLERGEERRARELHRLARAMGDLSSID